MNLIAQKIKNPVLNPAVRDLEGTEFISRAVSFIIRFLILFGFLYFILYFILGAYKFIYSQGQKDRIQEGKQQLMNALIGLIILFAIYAILKLIGNIFGIQNLENLKIIIPKL